MATRGHRSHTKDTGTVRTNELRRTMAGVSGGRFVKLGFDTSDQKEMDLSHVIVREHISPLGCKSHSSELSEKLCAKSFSTVDNGSLSPLLE